MTSPLTHGANCLRRNRALRREAGSQNRFVARVSRDGQHPVLWLGPRQASRKCSFVRSADDLTPPTRGHSNPLVWWTVDPGIRSDRVGAPSGVQAPPHVQPPWLLWGRLGRERGLTASADSRTISNASEAGSPAICGSSPSHEEGASFHRETASARGTCRRDRCCAREPHLAAGSKRP